VITLFSASSRIDLRGAAVLCRAALVSVVVRFARRELIKVSS
jgi:hypothetical protein